MRRRAGGTAAVEAIFSPFAWLTTAGEGLAGGAVMVASLLPGACVGMLAGLWLAGTPADSTLWPAEAAIGAVVGVAATLAALNVYVQWPTLRAKPEAPKKAKEPAPEAPKPAE
jgi:hypothetical protein